MISLSVIIITKNEEHNIAACLESASFASEWIVVDDDSSDRTCAVAAERGAKIVGAQPWCGFGAQKNRALRYATQDWVLSLDADERVTPELRRQIERAVRSPRQNCYAFPRRSWFCGQFMHYSGWYPDYVVRLFRRGTARFSDDIVHERLLPAGDVATLSEPLLHYSYANFSDVLSKLQIYSSAGGEALLKTKKSCKFRWALLRGFWAFVRTYIVRGGFLDGKLGFALAFYNAETVFYKYLKCWQQGLRPPPRNE